MIEQHQIERVVVAPEPRGRRRRRRHHPARHGLRRRVAVLPRMLEVIGTSVEFDDLGGQVLLGVRGFGLSPSSRVLKRTFDVVVGSA